MTLTQRLWLLGALLPAAATLASLLVSGQLFQRDLEASLDRALLAQAAVESVSLFDGPERKPHLHMSVSPLVEQVRHFAPQGVLFGPEGHPVVHYPPLREGEVFQERLVPERPGPLPTVTTRRLEDGTRQRQVVVNVLSPDGQPHALRLSASLAQVDGSVRAYYSDAVSMALLMGAMLLLLQTLSARWLSRRLAAITRQVGALRDGDFSRPLPPDGYGDEIGALRAALTEATEKLRAARAFQERLFADTAHELRTPLSLMCTRLDLALRRERSPEQLGEALRGARREVGRLANLASRLLELAAAGRGAWDRKKGELAEVVIQAVDLARAEAEQRQQLVHLELPAHAEAWFDPGSIRQAVDNLLSNALKFSPPGAAIWVRLSRTPASWQLRVEDEGPGIPEQEWEGVFSPFRRVGAKDTPGLGLGLAIVREVAQHHGGRAWVEARAGRGTTLVLELSASPPSVLAPSAEATS